MTHTTYSQETSNFKGKTIRFPSSDGLKITADFYATDRANAPLIILYHQARFSRGSYRSIAPKLNALGFNCLAVDLRSGGEIRGIVNETNKRAIEAEKLTNYVDALPDVETALMYAKNELNANHIIVWGSSYSASLVIYLGSQHTEVVKGILAFSPGEYFTISDKKIEDYAPGVICPVFITSAKNEHKEWSGIFAALKSEKYSFLPTQAGDHGSKVLWDEGKEKQAYWDAVESFLNTLNN